MAADIPEIIPVVLMSEETQFLIWKMAVSSKISIGGTVAVCGSITAGYLT